MKPLAQETLQWEHGYRCHGLWRGSSRVARVSIGPKRLWDGIYRWELDGFPATSGEANTLRGAKRQVEKALINVKQDSLARCAKRIDGAIQELRRTKISRR
jgi:hypothetical protein